MGALPDNWRTGVPLAPYTTLRVGGSAQYFVETRTSEELLEALSEARNHELPVTILGGGSNVVVADAGIAGLVLKQRDVLVEPLGDGRVRVSAGTEWDPLVHWAVHHRLAGLECLSGIPGLVGAAPIQNIGAYGRDVSEVIESVAVVDRSSGAATTLNVSDCVFAYRTSTFKTALKDRTIVTAVTFKLEDAETSEVRYRDLLTEFPDRTAPIIAIREAVLRIRAAKSMVWNEKDPNHRSVGSFFVNPVVSTRIADAVDEVAGEPAPRFPTATRDIKLPAAWLIERAGFRRGYVQGPVGISSAHALALVNRGGAKAQDILALADLIQTRVYETFAIELQREPVHLGFIDRDPK